MNDCKENKNGNCNIDGGVCVAKSYTRCSIIQTLKGEKENGK